MRGISVKCQKHSRLCKELCKQCDILVCPDCVSSGEHSQHGFEDVVKVFEGMKELMQKRFT